MGKKYVVSERVHYMCPNMHLGIMVKIDKHYNRQRVQKSLNTLVEAHPLLGSIIGIEENTGRPYYKMDNKVVIIPFESESVAEWQIDFDKYTKPRWNVTREPLLKCVVYEEKKSFFILFIAHHLLCDARALLQLALEFADNYVFCIKIPRVEEKLISSINDLPKGSELSVFSKLLIKGTNRKYKVTDTDLVYDDYLNFEEHYRRDNTVSRKVVKVGKEVYEYGKRQCLTQGISALHYLIACMMIEKNTNSILLNSDIRRKCKNYNPGAIGNYSTTYSISCSKIRDVEFMAKQIKQTISDIKENPQKEMKAVAYSLCIKPEILDKIAMSQISDPDNKYGEYVSDTMFGLDSKEKYGLINLGKVESSAILDGFFIPPTAASKEEVWGIITINEKMRITKCRA